MSWAAVIVGGSALIGGAVSSNAQKGAANKASNASQSATQQAIAQQNLNYDRTATNLSPGITAGNNALGQMQSLNSGDYSSFNASPDYQFTMDQGLQGLDRSAASRGGLYSGGQSADVLKYAQGLASQQYNNYYSKLAGLAQQGQGAAANLGSIGAGQSAAIGGYLNNNALLQGNATQNSANATGQLVNTGIGALSQMYGQFHNPTTSSYGSTAAPYNPGALNGQTLDQTYSNFGGGSFPSLGGGY
jgi:hypothetical protein